MVLNLTPAERKLLAHVLRLAANEYGNHGANSLDLVKEVGLTPEQSLEVRTTITRDGDYPNDAVSRTDHTAIDWQVMMHFALKLEKCGPAGVEG